MPVLAGFDLGNLVTIKLLRKQYMEMPLLRDQLLLNPVDQFALWYEQARAAELHYPHAMGLSTTSQSNEVTSRIVLLRYFDQRGFVFFSGFETEKADQIAENPLVALLFSWLDLERQVRITGTAGRVSAKESLRFFASRSRDNQIGAWLSQSTGVITSRNVLKAKLAEVKQSFQGKKIPLPGGWGGYRVIPKTIEFWQGRNDGLHDRFKYTRLSDDDWEIQRLLP